MSISSHPLDTFAATSVLPANSLYPTMPAEIGDELTRLGLSEQFPLASQLTRELFGDEFEVTIEPDAEIANWRHVVFTVRTTGSMDEILAKNTQWHRRLPHTTTEARGAFCLSIDEKP